MTVGELRSALESVPDSLPVVVEYQECRMSDAGTWLGDFESADVMRVTNLDSRCVIDTNIVICRDDD